MDIATICQHFHKSRNTVDKAVAKLIKHYPDKGWKYKNPETRRITIKAEGVEMLSTYFRKEKNEISAVETELRLENEKLQAILEEKEKTIANLEALYTERLELELEKSRQTFLLEQKNKDATISEQNVRLSEQEETISGQEVRLNEQEQKISDLEQENQKLKQDQQVSEKKTESLHSELDSLRQQQEEYKRKEEEYNSKSFFYRLTHKFSLS